MSALLSHYPGNDKRNLDSRYGAVIAEFQSPANARNEYLHGLWWTKADGHVYLQTENIEISIFNSKRRILRKDFERFIQRCTSLTRAIDALELSEYRTRNERRTALRRLVMK